MSTDLATLVTYNPFAFTSSLTIADAWSTMLQMGLDAVPVRGDNFIVAGIVRHRDLCHQAIDGGVRDSNSLSDCVTPAPSHHSEATPAEILDLLLKHDLPIMPIVDSDKLVGVVSRSDFLRELSFHELPCANRQVLDHIRKAEDWFESDNDMDDAVTEEERLRADCLAIGQGDMLISVISPKALTRAWSSWHFKRLMQYEVGKNEPTTLIMLARFAPIAQPGSSLAEVASSMLEHNVDAVAVGNAGRRVLGFVTAKDLLKAIRSDLD